MKLDMQIRGLLRKRFVKEKPKVQYPRVELRPATLLVKLPEKTDATKVNITYPLLEPFAKAHIFWDENEKSLFYEVKEPEITSEEKELLQRLESQLIEVIDVKLSQIRDRDRALEYIEEKINKILSELELQISKETYERVMYYILRDFVGLNEIEPILHDPYIEDLGCSGLGVPIFVVHLKYGTLKTNISYNDIEYLNNFVIKLSERCGRYISYAKPLLDGSLPDGSRVQASLAKDVTTRGPTFSIRKFRKNPLSPVDLLNLKTVSPQSLAYLWFLIENNASILVCGGVATGKTTFLNVLSIFIPPANKVVSIEDTRELNIPHENWIPTTTRTGFGVPEAGGRRYGEIELFDLLKESFRMKPDYTIVGEVRGKEAYVMFQGISSGNPSLGTIHAGSVEDVIKRLQTPPIELSPSLIESLDVIIVMVRATEKGESARRVKEVTEIESIDTRTGNVRAVRVFTWIPSVDEHKDETSNSQLLRRIAFEKGYPYQQVVEDLKNKAATLAWLQKNKLTDHQAVAGYVNLYYKDKKHLLEMVKRDLKPQEAVSKKEAPSEEAKPPEPKKAEGAT